MFNLSFIELAFFALVGLLVLDVDDIPKLAKTLRGYLNKFAEFKYEVTSTLNEATKELNIKETLKAVEEEKNLMEKELKEIVKDLPDTTSSSEIIKLNKQSLQKEEEKN